MTTEPDRSDLIGRIFNTFAILVVALLAILYLSSISVEFRIISPGQALETEGPRR